MSSYDDLFLRHNLDDNGSGAPSGPASASPDIIPVGSTPVPDPGNFFSRNYATDPGQAIVPDLPNYVYLRARNLASGSTTGTAALYFAPASLLLYPSLWRNNPVRAVNGSPTVPLTASAPGGIAVTTTPFSTVLPPVGGSAYSLIGRIATAAHPNPIPDIQTIDALADYMAAPGGIACRNVALADTSSPVIAQSVGYRQGPQGARVSLLLSCSGVPIGSQVMFAAGAGGPSPAVALPPTTVTTPQFTVGVTSMIPADWESTILYTIRSNGQPLPLGWSVSLLALYLPSSDSPLRQRARPLAELGLASASDFLGGGRPVTAIVVGSHTMRGR